jgi:hypothetical protein
VAGFSGPLKNRLIQAAVDPLRCIDIFSQLCSYLLSKLCLQEDSYGRQDKEDEDNDDFS